MKRSILTILILMLGASLTSADDIAITIYNDNFGLVKQTRTLEFRKGIGEIRFDDVAARIDPTSVHISPKESGIAVLEQNFQYDLVNTQKMMQRYLGSEIGVVTKGGELHRGSLLSFDGKFVILKSGSGEITITNAEEIVDYRFGSLPEGLILKPTLVWLTESESKQKSACEVSYLTDGINWHAEYVAVVDQDDKNLDLSGWVSIDNKSGMTYKDAALKLVAGKVHRVDKPVVMARSGAMNYKADKAVPFQEEAFFEYHLYTLTRTSTVADNEIKQLSLFPETKTSATKVYIVEGRPYQYWNRGQDDKPKVKVNLEFVNSEKHGLGMPLPKGKLRVYKADKDGALQFVGEDRIDHTPKNEKIRVMLGEAFDIVCERKKTDHIDLGADHYRATYEITLRNHKDDDVVVTVVEPTLGWREWHILKSNIEFKKVSAYKVEFPVSVKSNDESKLTYTIEY
ncbi:MAG: DUF4139 domain-containing protein [candidate division Zixibacteria bacterium]